MCLFKLIKENHRMRRSSNSFGQLPSFVLARERILKKKSSQSLRPQIDQFDHELIALRNKHSHIQYILEVVRLDEQHCASPCTQTCQFGPYPSHFHSMSQQASYTVLFYLPP